MITINVPAGGPSHIYGIRGEVYRSRVEDGRLVVDVLPTVYKMLIANRQTGLDWERANPEVLAQLARV